jgi:hypothetical protein
MVNLFPHYLGFDDVLVEWKGSDALDSGLVSGVATAKL